MLIDLKLIKPSPHPVRTSWDEEKMNELAQSIKEQGLIVPVKLRPLFTPCARHGLEWFTADSYRIEQLVNCDWCDRMLVEVSDDEGEVMPTYEIVYGHRRVEAARRAGMDAVEAIVEGVNDENALIQALIENVQREDMMDIDVAKAFLSMRAIGITDEEISKKVGWHTSRIRSHVAMMNAPDAVRNVMETHASLTESHFRASSSVHADPETRAEVLKKAYDEDLSFRQTEKLAKSVAATQDPARREALLNTPYSSFIHDPEINRDRAQKYGASDPLSMSREPSQGDAWAMTQEVKIILDYLQSSRKMVEEVEKMRELGKFAPEAIPFVSNKIRAMIDAWGKLLEKWSEIS